MRSHRDRCRVPFLTRCRVDIVDLSIANPSPSNFVVLMPARDDWESAGELIRRMDKSLGDFHRTIDILIVDDGSRQEIPSGTFDSTYTQLRSIKVLRLRRNLGHQRAIAIGLVYIESFLPCEAVLVMDSDGEDTPDGALQLLTSFTGKEALFAQRTRRTESFVFKLFYRIYKAAHRLLTGISVQVGNFSILPSSYLPTLTVMSELWNHYAAAVFRSGLRFATTPVPRGFRIAGKSRMNFVSLVAHGISAMSVFGDIVGVRILLVSMGGASVALLGIIAAICIRIFTTRAIPGWATYSIGLLAVILMQFITMAASFTFTTLSDRTSLNFVQLRDYKLLISSCRDMYRYE